MTCPDFSQTYSLSRTWVLLSPLLFRFRVGKKLSANWACAKSGRFYSGVDFVSGIDFERPKMGSFGTHPTKQSSPTARTALKLGPGGMGEVTTAWRPRPGPLFIESGQHRLHYQTARESPIEMGSRDPPVPRSRSPNASTLSSIIHARIKL